MSGSFSAHGLPRKESEEKAVALLIGNFTYVKLIIIIFMNGRIVAKKS